MLLPLKKNWRLFVIFMGGILFVLMHSFAYAQIRHEPNTESRMARSYQQINQKQFREQDKVGGTLTTFKLSLISIPENGGKTSTDPDKEFYDEGEQVRIRATANTNYKFDHWSGDIDERSNNPTLIYMRRDRTIYANFVYVGEEHISAPDTIIGPQQGYVDVELAFSAHGSESDSGHVVEYQFDWGDGSQSDWGDSTQSHAFHSIGEFTIKVRARCSQHTSANSDWYSGIIVSITELLSGYNLTVDVIPDSAGVVQIKPRKNLYAENEDVLLYALPINENGVFNSNYFIEAETCELQGNFWLHQDSSASGNYYIYGTEGSPRDGEAAFEFNIENPGSYYVWGRCFALSESEDSFFFLMDDGDTLTWHLDKQYNEWRWQQVSHQHQLRQFVLSAGHHTMKIIKRDLNARLDKLILTQDANFLPQGMMPFPIKKAFSFRFWGGNFAGIENPIQIVMDNDKSMVAHFDTGAVETISEPAYISGPDSGFIGDSLMFSTGGALSSMGNIVEYQFDWGDNIFSEWGDSVAYHAYFQTDTFWVRTRARSIIDTSLVSGWNSPMRVLVFRESLTVPTIFLSPDTGYVGKFVEIEVGGSIDNKGVPVVYQVDWGDSSITDWRADSIFQHVYNDTGTFYMRVRAKSAVTPDVISDWSQSKKIYIEDIPQQFFSLTLFLDPESAGTVVVNPQKEKYSSGDTVKIEAIPAGTFTFARWGGDIDTTVNPFYLIMSQDFNIIAYFVEIPEFVTKPAIPVGPDSGMVGAQLTFSTTGAVCNLNHEVEYQFDWGDSTLSDWGGMTRVHIYGYGDTMSVMARARCKENKTIISEWSDAHTIIILETFNYVINITIDPPGSGSVNRTPYKSSYEAGEVVILSPLAAPEYVFDRWSGDLTGTDNPGYIIVNENKNITAHFHSITGVAKIDNESPEKYLLSQNYPNPFNLQSTIQFQLPTKERVRLTIYNITGQKIATLINQWLEPGNYRTIWDADDESGRFVPTGIYLYEIHAGNFRNVKKMTLLR